jgi:hypothetical protein
MNTQTTSRLARLLGRAAPVALAAGMTLGGLPALAQTAPAAVSAAATPSESAVVNLIRLLVQQGVITQDAADQLMRQAESEAAQARAASSGGALPAAAPGVLRVPYVPEVVKNQIRDEIRQEVLAQAKTEGWAAPNLLPEWLNGVTISGDVRARYQGQFYDPNNTNELIDYAGFNDDGPTDINPLTGPGEVPFLNTRQDQNLLRLRARLGLIAKPVDRVTLGIRLATGSDNSPVSTNQTLGGGLVKKDIWLDQAYVRLDPLEYVSFIAGRMPNPYYSTDLVYDDDLNFDGLALQGRYKDIGGSGFGISGTLGAFPLQYSSADFPGNSPQKAEQQTKWLYGAQLVADYKSESLSGRLGVAYYNYENIQGELSSPCGLFNGNDSCDTDFSRPAFMQKGNTLFLIRNIVPDPANPLNFEQPQFLGLSHDYDLLNINGELNWTFYDKYQLWLTADYVKNLGYDEGAVCRYAPLGLPVNNIAPGLVDANDPNGAVNVDPCSAPPPGGTKAVYESGDTGWMVRLGVGQPSPRAWGQWNFVAGYKYLEPDAVVDAYTDSDFHLGGTNAQGYFIAASVGLYRNTWLTARWLSANEVIGPPLAIDVGQIDLNIGF